MQKPQSTGAPGGVGDRKTATGKATLSSVGGSCCATCAAHLEPRSQTAAQNAPLPSPRGGSAAHRITCSSTPPPSPSRYYAKALCGYHHLRDNFHILLVFLPLTNTRISGTIELRRTGKPFKRQPTPSCLERGILFSGCRHFTTAKPPFSRGFFLLVQFFHNFFGDKLR